MTNNLDSLLETATFQTLLEELAELSPRLETDFDWPEAPFSKLAEAGVLGWVIPEQFGGISISPAQLTLGYEKLSQACLLTTFVLTQRNGACQRIASGENEILKEKLLSPLCRGELFATVGISHLTTSRQHLKQPAVVAEQTDRGFLFNGNVPWVTGANRADYIVTGGTCDDGRQLLAAIATKQEGVQLGEPARMLALNASQTGPVTLTDVEVPYEDIIAGPVEHVMKQGQGGGTGSLTTSALALGAAARSIAAIGEEALMRPDLSETFESLDSEYKTLLADLSSSAFGEEPSDRAADMLTSDAIRRRANSLVLRAAQAHLGASKGAGFVSGHPAERAVREAMFFLVWSCPQPVLSAALKEFACAIGS